MVECFIGLGSNLDDPVEQVSRAISRLSEIPDTILVDHSSLYWSRAQGLEEQPDFINAVARVKTQLAPEALLEQLFLIEKEHGRTREIRWGARTLDLDLLLYGSEQLNSSRLQVPHPRLYERNFVLYPLYELAPKLQVPGLGPLLELLESCTSNGLWKHESTQ